MDFKETKSFLLTLIVFITLRYADADGVISFVTQHVRVEEVQYAEATFNLKRESGSTGPVFFYCKIMNNTGTADFISLSVNGQFGDGVTSSTCTFTVIEDNTPEPNITYSVQVFIQSGIATIGADNTAYVTILSNDDPYGIIQFQNANERIAVEEPLQGQQSIATFNIERRKGTIGTSTVFWQASNGVSSNIQDFSPVSGFITFNNGDSLKQLNISILPDKVPENLEQFIIDLINATGGAAINSSASRSFLDIPANDPPIRFLQSSQTVSESQTLLITVTRGTNNVGLVGNTNMVTTVNYNTVDGSARAGVDYQAASGMLTFANGETRKTLSIVILKDQLPEMAENFTLVLSNPSQGSVLDNPSTLTVFIQKNDDPHGVISFENQSQIVVLDEDAQNSGILKVNRSRGTFGAVSVSWRAMASSRSPGFVPNQVINITEGVLTFSTGVSTSHIFLAARQDVIPEEAVEFYIQLANVTGGARLDPLLPQTTLIVKDSDNAYGVISLGNASQNRVDLLTTPRRIIVPVRRSGGALGSVRVNYTVIYLLPGSSMPSNDIELNHSGYVTLSNSSYNATIYIGISESSFVRSDAAFVVTITSVQLQKQTIIAPSSPIIGNPRTTFINVTSQMANGEISFFGNPVSLNVNEPNNGQISNISLLVMRDGVSGSATVRWRLIPTTNTLTMADVSPWNGTIYFPPGADRVNLTFSIHPDNIPELNEVFTIELTNVTERNERIRVGANQATVTIDQNDNAGGIFEFNYTGNVILMEGDVNFVDIIRLDGALTTQRVQVTILGGQNDFISYQNILKFSPNQRKQTFYIFTNDDNIPEANENFTMVLTSIDGTVLGRKTSIIITILQNDDANGVFSFANASMNLIKYADEIRGSAQTVSFDIQRQRGTFSNVSVFWNVTSLSGTNASLDLETLNGFVHFSQGQNSLPLQIRILPDIIPEGEERFRIQLINITGGGRLVQPLNATLIVNPNDAPIHFLNPLQVHVLEGQSANLTIGLNRTLIRNVTVFVSTIDFTASASAGDYRAVRNQAVVFQTGETRKVISITTLNDNIPEIAEEFIVRLNASTGDTVLIPPLDARVIITANDQPYGVFQFSQASLSKVASEGDTVSLEVLRSRGTFANVTVTWEILSNVRVALNNNGEFVKAKGNLVFREGSTREFLSINVRNDGVPELNETFYIRLINVTGNFAIQDGGYLGNQTEAMIIVLPSDDPYGVIEFAPSSLQVNVAEDYLPGHVNATHANLTVERTKGTVGSMKVIWQLYKASNIPSDTWDLIFYGQRGSDVIEGTGRNGSRTPSMIFNASNASYIYVNSMSQPAFSQIQDGFSLSFWMKPGRNSNGTLIAKRSTATNEIIYQLSINSSISDALFVLQVNRYLYNIYVPSSVNIFDGGWHSLVLTISRSTFSAYLNGVVITNSRSLAASVSSTDGHIYLGCSLPTRDHYEGALQDVRIYSSILIPAFVSEISSTIKALTPVNGYLMYNPGMKLQNIVLKTIDNSIPEPEIIYNIKLIGITGVGRMGSAINSRVTILKSDNANGVFGFLSSNCQSRVNENDTSIAFEVSRAFGTFGAVRINWEIRRNDSSRILASNDFHAATGSFSFSQGQTKKQLVIRPLDDSVPEFDEQFELRLVSAVSTDGTISSTPTSGASINTNSNTCNVTITSNDNPHGVFQIAGSMPNGTGIIPVMARPGNLQVSEESGRITIYVVRAQGVQGTITCEWKTNQITARGNVDFREDVGTVRMQTGQNLSSIPINIIDNNIPELEKIFNVQLYNPTGGAILGAASYLNISILPSDNAYGVFSFANASLNTTASESSNAILSIVRIGGNLGTVRVTWRLNNGSSDFGLQNGSVVFANGQSTSQISIPVIDDRIPELTESFSIQLVSVINGKLSPKNTEAIIQIIGNDDPYGTFEITPLRTRVVEQNTSLQLSITRRGGSLGIVRVSYQTFVPSSSVTYATPNVDFVAVSNAVNFVKGQTEAKINITIIGDGIPEADEYFMVNLTEARLLGSHEIVADSPKLGVNKVAEIIIQANDNANGILHLSSATVAVTEGINWNFLNVTRSGGTFGQVSVRFTIANQNTILGSDYQISSYTITLMDGQRDAVVPIRIINDDLPEFNESFVIRLEESSLTGGATLGFPRECTVTILENDYPYGLFGFASGSLNVTISEPATGTASVRLTVLRSGGTSGTAQLGWNATVAGYLANDDVTPSTGNVRFISGQSSQDIEIFVKADNIPEDNESIMVMLGTISNGNAAIDMTTRSATINIPANDDPYGIIQFNQSSMMVEERDVDYFVHIPVTRTKGFFRSIRVTYRTINPSSGVNGAKSGGDYEAVVSQSIIMGPGIASSNVTVKIINDNIPELNEHFIVELTRAEVIGLPAGSNVVPIGEPKTVNVTIRANDQPFGLLGIYMKNTGGSGTNYAIIEPDSGATSVTFEVRRNQGSLGIVSVSWRVSSSSSVNVSSDVSGVSGGMFTFLSGQTSKEFIVQIHSDNIPESDESLIIELYDAQGGAVIDTASQRATLVIMANDGVGGRIGFSSGSRSKSVAEGENVPLMIYRTAPAAGNVSMNWTIEGVNATRDFLKTSGVVNIPQGTTSFILSLQTLNDSTPESHETFTVRLSNPTTSGISSTGAATLVPGDSTAIIIIGASDEPHGIVQFAPRSQPIRVTENVGTVELRLVRIMGNIGNIAVHYQLHGVRISDTTTEGRYGEDFNSTINNTVIIPDGSDSATIRVNIIDDGIPEQDEAFFVNITGVTLIGASNITTPPKIGTSTYMQIIIAANDGTQGELAFAPRYARITVSEEIGTFNITVIRYKGSFGNVYAFYYLNRLTASSADFDIPGGVMAGGPVKLAFANGEKERNITVIIRNDNITETDEQFEIGLTIQNAVGNGGVKIGKPDKSLVTIAANDDANGVIRFAARSQTQYITETGNGPSANNTATFFIERSVGLFGNVNVQWRVLHVTNMSDINPISGLITFEQNVREKFFQINAVADNIPELRKEYTVQLTVVSGGARLSTPSSVTLVIAANDDPHGLLSIRSFPSMTSSMNIEESTKFVRAVISRSGGNLGEISVQYHTRDNSALSTSGDTIQFGFDQVMDTSSAEKFYSFKAYRKDYLLLASSYRKGVVGSDITGNTMNEPYQSMLFRWQGTYVPVFNIKTDGGVKWSSFEDQNITYVIAVNYGTVGRYETMSQVLKLHRNETLELVQNIATKGGRDVGIFESGGSFYMVVINMKDNSGNTVQQSQLLRWQGSRFILESSALETKGGSAIAVCHINRVVYIAVANSYDSATNSYITASNVYSWSEINKRFSLVQSISTNDARDADCVRIGNENYLMFTSSKGNSRLYRYKATTPIGFVEVQELASGNSGKFFKWNYTDYLVIASNKSVVYKWNNSTNSFNNITDVPVQNALDIQPFSIHDPVAGALQYLAVTASSSSKSYLVRLAMLSINADYVPRRGVVSFFQGQTSLNLDLTILSDTRPEMDERFSVELASPTGGASLAPNPNLAITILSNSNAYGRMAFAERSLNVNVTEMQWETVLKLDVLREFGSFGQISLNWNVSSIDGSAVSDLYPTQGQLNLNQGISTASIFINVRADGISELDEKFIVRLTSVSIAGAATSNRSPTINHLKSTSSVTILANNEPYGVVGWKNRIEITTEEKEVNTSAMLIIMRSFGTLADVRIDYETKQAANVSQMERVAIPGVDYFTKKSYLIMKRGEREAAVYIKVRHMEKKSELFYQLISDNITNINEIFNVDITGVSLISGTYVPNSPRIDPNRRQVEVVITEVALNRGMIEFEAPFVQRVSENIGTLTLNLIRTNGSEGSVGVHFSIESSNASSNDYSPQNGLITFSNNVTRSILNITIVNDNNAELDEVFIVKLIKPSGGVKIGPQNQVAVTITENDYPYGLLSFSSASRIITNVREGQTIHLTVDRHQGVYRTVQVDWTCGSSAQRDLTPWFGTLTFAENATQSTITIQTINDTTPELTESFTCVLSNPRNGVVISTDNNASITILPSDKPYGIISIDSGSRQLVVAEPNGAYNGAFSVGILRSVGFDGLVSVQWRLNAIYGIDDANSTFNVTSGILSFASGVSTQRIYLQVLDDGTPEESKIYQIYLERTTGGAELDVPANTRSSITVAASDNPYGTIRFVAPFRFNVSESAGAVNLSLTRFGGTIGQLRVSFTTSSATATPGIDYTPSSGALTFNPGEGAKIIQFNIVDDSIPELDEMFVINITSAMIMTKVLNTATVNGIQIDTPPKIGPQSTAEITIDANDKPYGEIGFLQSRRLVHESDGIIQIPVNRTGGTFGTSIVTYTHTDGTALNPADYSVTGATLTFAPGESQKFIQVQIKDDRLSEFQENFRLDLTSISGPAVLGSITRLNITIETSDNPFGLFGIFNTSLSVSVENPNASQSISFPVYRKDGTLSRSEVSWRVVRNMASASLVTEDITPANGIVLFDANERGPKLINITILTAGGPEEPEEQFTLQLQSVTGGAALDHAFTNVTITILKKGHPNGLFRLIGTVRPNLVIAEPQSGATQIAIPVQREFGSTGPVTVQWSIRSSNGNAGNDFAPFNTSLLFANGETSKDIQLSVVADSVPEIDEIFEVNLVSASNGAEINAARNKINFTVSANDYPHGLFKLDQTNKTFEFLPSTSARILHFAIDRTQGTIGHVLINVLIRYSSDGSSDSHAVNFTNGQNKVSTSFNIASGRFLEFGSNITISLQSASIIGTGSSMAPEIMSGSSPLLMIIPENAANSVINFDASTRYPTASTTYQVSNVQITRKGLFGSISVNWRSGYPPGSFTIGSINPSQGTVSFNHGERTKSISFQIQMPAVLQIQLIYSVYLSSSTPAQGQPGWPKIGSSKTAIVDPHGLVEIAPTNLNVTVVEGSKASIVVRRLLSTVGTIRVSYMTQKYIGSNAATEGDDFTPVSSTFEMINGQSSVTINIDTLEDNAGTAERDEYFYVALTSVQVISNKLSASSPRLTLNNRATVKIRDNDNPFGVISFTAQSLTPRTQESRGHVVLQLVRTGGVFSRSSVLVRSIGGGESWQNQVINNLPSSSPVRNALNARTQAASAVAPNQDYSAINQEVVFEELNAIPSGGQIKTINISISTDAISEPAEQIIVVITNVTGGASLPSSSNPLKEFSVITIDGNGLWNGEIGFTQNVATINEDGSAQAVLPLERKRGSAQSIEVQWQVWSTVPNIASQVISASGRVSFAAGNATSSITINLMKDQVPEFASWFSVNISTTASGAVITNGGSGLFSTCNITMLESDYPAGRIGFSDSYRFPVVTLNDKTKDIRVRRYGGTLKAVTVLYQTISLVNNVVIGDIVMTPARENQDFTPAAGQLSFPLGSTEAIINIKLTPEKASSSSYPKVFNITLESPTNGAVLYDLHKSEQVIISNDAALATFLRLRSSALRVPLTDRDIENIFTEMLQLVKVTPLTETNQGLVMKTIRLVMAYKSSQPIGQRALSNSSKSLLLDVYDSLLSTSRTDTRGKSEWALLLDDIAYHFLNDMSCPYTFKGTKSNFALTARRDYGKDLNGVKFTSGRNADFFRYPINMFSSTGSTPCTDIHFIDYGNQQFFSTTKNILNNKVMSSKIKSGLSAGMKVVYRVHTTKARVAQVGTSCVIWKHPVAGVKGDWISNNCKLRGKSTNYVECECQHLSEYAVIALSDNRTGYEIYFYVACYILIGACFLALIAHHLCALDTTFTANLLMHLIFAIMMTNILFVVGAHISPKLTEKTLECGIIGISINYFFVAQFTTMFAQACNLWRIFIMNDEHTNRKYLHFFVIGWGFPIIIIVGYVLITYAVYRWPFATMYGDVHSNGDMCFIANVYAALGSAVFPAILFSLGVMVVLVQSYYVKPQWKCYDDVYTGRYNFKEMRHIIAIFALLCVTWLFAGLHLAFGSLWLIIVFTIFNIILGLYILIIYAVFRNQMRYSCHREYALRSAPSLISDHELIYAPNSLNHSSRKLMETQSNKLSDWEDVELPIGLNPMDLPDNTRIIESPNYGRGQINESYDIESDEFDDLIFALKTGGRLTPVGPEEQELEEKQPSPRPVSTDQPQIRRIKIADTHL